MPNLKSPVTNAEKAVDYRQAINAVVPEDTICTPLMTLYLTDQTSPQDIVDAKAAGVVAVKWYQQVQRHCLIMGCRIGDKWMLYALRWLKQRCCY